MAGLSLYFNYRANSAHECTHTCWGPAVAGLRVPQGWMAQAKNAESDTKFDARERPALGSLAELSEFNQALFL